MLRSEVRLWVPRGLLSICERLTLNVIDGGGVRGYSSLLILKRHMERIRVVELELDERTRSSADYRRDGGESQGTGEPELSQFLPCHYFDYMAGTSTGGYVRHV